MPRLGVTQAQSERLHKIEAAGKHLLDIINAVLDLSKIEAGKRVLVVEDEPVNRQVALSLLEEAGLVVDLADDGEQALHLAKRNRYQVILMDLQMPVTDGLEATRQIRQLADHRYIPIVAMTAGTFEEGRQRCTEGGMADFLAKPVDPDALFAALLPCLANRGQPYLGT